MFNEIERKWLIDGFPSMSNLGRYKIEQTYLKTDPEIRIRKKEPWGFLEAEFRPSVKHKHVLTYKSKGGLKRKEFEIPIPGFLYKLILKRCTEAAPLQKDYRRYFLKASHLIIETSQVDNSSFFYAEVEFESVEEANAFKVPDWFGMEVTGNDVYKMKNYFKSSLRQATINNSKVK